MSSEADLGSLHIPPSPWVVGTFWKLHVHSSSLMWDYPPHFHMKKLRHEFESLHSQQLVQLSNPAVPSFSPLNTAWREWGL